MFRLPSFFADGMVLQRDRPIRVFGWAASGTPVQVHLDHHTAEMVADQEGLWAVSLPALPAGGPHTLRVRSGRRQISVRDILMGDVWFCSGQSNMEFNVAGVRNAHAVVRCAHSPLIRHFHVERAAEAEPSDDVTGRWASCTLEAVEKFTAVGYFFAREIVRRTGVPVGIIHASWGGSALEAWIPPQAYRTNPVLKGLLRVQQRLRRPDRLLKEQFAAWEKEHVSLDPGNQGEACGWARPDFDDRSWKTMRVPGCWETRGLSIDGSVWFRRRVRIPRAWVGRELQLDLGPLDDFDVTYCNGVPIGKTGEWIENAYKVPRTYRVPAECVRSSNLCLAVRIFDRFGSGGFVGPKELMRLFCPGRSRDASIALEGKWRYQVEWSVERPGLVPQPPALPEPRAQLSRLYNGMTHAFVRLPVRGFLWYQGESNAFRAAHYQEAFPALIQAWRDAWKDDDAPFYFVQLANFKTCPARPGEDYWAELREAQARALRMKKTGMAVAIDVGDANDIHPRNKAPVGRRLARLALARDYGKPVADIGPVPSAFRFESDKVIVEFDHVGSGLQTADGQALRGFALAGKNRVWAWAQARIKGGGTVVIRADTVPKPCGVRYGWSSNPNCNLENSHRLPAAPFRSDDWPRLTEGKLWPS